MGNFILCQPAPSSISPLFRLLPTLAGEFWAGDGYTEDVGIEVWDNQSGGDDTQFIQVDGNYQPTPELDTWGDGGPALRWDGTDDHMTSSDLAPEFTGTDTPYTVLLYGEMIVADVNKTLWSATGPSGGEIGVRLVAGFMGLGSAYQAYRHDDGAGSVVSTSWFVPVDTGIHLYAFVFDGTALSMYVDATPVFEDQEMDVAGTTINAVHIGWDGVNLSSCIDMRFAQISICSSALTPAERASATNLIEGLRPRDALTSVITSPLDAAVVNILDTPLLVEGTCGSGCSSVEVFGRVNAGAYASWGTDLVNPATGTFSVSRDVTGDVGAVDMYARATRGSEVLDSAVISITVSDLYVGGPDTPAPGSLITWEPCDFSGDVSPDADQVVLWLFNANFGWWQSPDIDYTLGTGRWTVPIVFGAPGEGAIEVYVVATRGVETYESAHVTYTVNLPD